MHHLQRGNHTGNSIKTATCWHSINMRSDNNFSSVINILLTLANANQISTSINMASKSCGRECFTKPLPPPIKFGAEHEASMRTVRFSYGSKMVNCAGNPRYLVWGCNFRHIRSIIYGFIRVINSVPFALGYCRAEHEQFLQ